MVRRHGIRVGARRNQETTARSSLSPARAIFLPTRKSFLVWEHNSRYCFAGYSPTSHQAKARAAMTLEMPGGPAIGCTIGAHFDVEKEIPDKASPRYISWCWWWKINSCSRPTNAQVYGRDIE
jgi:hypothetical protein